MLVIIVFVSYDLSASAACAQDKGCAEERENEATASGFEHRRDVKSCQLWTGYVLNVVNFMSTDRS